MQYDVDGRDAAIRRHELIAQQRLGQSDLTTARALVVIEKRTVAKEILDDEVVLDAIAVLKVADRVDADRVGDLPGFTRQQLHRGYRVARERVSTRGLQNEQKVVVLRVSRL